MNVMPLSALNGSETRATDLTTFTVQTNDAELPATIRTIAIDITREVNRIPTARLIVHDGDAAKQDFEISAGDSLVPGNTIKIAAGYSLDENVIFEGVITKQCVRARRAGGSRLHIEAKDPAFRMTLDRKSKYFEESTDADVFEEIIEGYSDLTAEVDTTTETYQEIVQYRATDWDFLVTRAERIGMVCLVEDGTVRIAKPNPAQEAVKSVAFGTGIFDLDMELDARTQFASVTASAWDPADQAITSSDVTDVSAPEQGNLAGADLAAVGGVETAAFQHTGPFGQGELDAWAEAGMTKSRFAKIRGTVRFQGTEIVAPGDLIEIGGVGDRFNGTAYVSGVRHQIGRGDWETTVQLGLDPKWHHERFPVSAPAAAGLHPGVRGLQIGVVTQLQGDPAGENRIQVHAPVIDAEGAGVWTRVVTLDAGAGRGSFFLPEIGDEVVIGFLNDDPRHPVMLGMLNSSNKPAPLEASDDNHEKGFVTRSGIKLLFNDDTPSVSIETPAGHQVLLDDGDGKVLIKDGGGSTVTLDASGITLESPADIVMKATGNVTIEGVNVDVKASAALTAEGSATAALKSSGATEVKGSIVQIN